MSSRLRLAAVRIAAAVVAAEIGAAIALALVGPRLFEPIRTTRAIFQEQSRLIRELIEPNDRDPVEIHPVFGWRYTPGFHHGLHQLNASGIRAAREYSRTPADGVLRIAAFGDSFVYGSEVANDDAWPYLLEANDGLEVLNYGVPAYGLDQAYLRYEVEGDAYHPSVILVGFSPPVFPRLVSVYRRFFNNADIPLFKPRFAIEASGELSLLPSPVQSRAEYGRLLARPRDVIPLGRNDSWYEPLVYRNPLFDYSALVRLGAGTASRLGRRIGRDRVIADGVFNPDSTAFTIQMKLFAMFAALAERRHTRLLVVLLPDYRTIGAFRRGEAAVYTTIADALRAARIESVDAAEIFRGAADVDQWFATGGHYSARGNRMIAAWLGGVIRDRFGPAGSRPAARRPSAHHAR